MKTILAIGLINSFAAHAYGQQVVSDRSLPGASVVTSSDNTFVITGGTAIDRHLFHSFEEFSVPTNGVASFRGVDPQVTDIFTRVTGGNRSTIDGTLEIRQNNGSISTANFFLLNPNGIVFGPNASLNVGGSFVATTGDRILFADGAQFTAAPDQTSPLLTVSAPIGIQFGLAPGEVRNQSRANTQVGPFRTPIAGGLQVPRGQTLALVGGDVVFQRGIAVATAGRVELGSVADFEQISLLPTQTGWRVEYSDAQDIGNIRLTGRAGIGGLDGSAIALRGGRIAFVDESQVVSESDARPGAAVRLHAAESVVLSRSLLGSRTFGDGNAGDLYVAAPQLRLFDRGAIASETRGDGNSGAVRVRAATIRLQENARIGTTTASNGNGGHVSIRASDSVFLDGAFPIADSSAPIPDPTQLYSSATERASRRARAGQLTIETSRLVVRDGAQVNASTFGAADAGDLVIRAETIELSGVRLRDDGEPFFNAEGFTVGSGLFAQAERRPSANAPSSGDGGNLELYTRQLTILDGAGVGTNTYGFGDAGNITVHADERVEISGAARADSGFAALQETRQVPSGLYSTAGGVLQISAVYEDASGRGGNIRIITPELRVLDDAFIGVGSSSTELDTPGAGRLEIFASSILLDRGNLNAETEFGNLATITLRNVDLLTLRNNSDITTTAGAEFGSGDGGDINIDADFIIATPRENNDISANAFSGSGGRVEITSQRIFGLVPLSRDELEATLGETIPDALDPQRLSSNDITAISQLNPQLNGQVIFITPDVDPSQGIVELPADIVDASQLVAQGCATGDIRAADKLGEFIVTGRGGLSLDPDALPSSDFNSSGWVELPSQPDPLPATTSSEPTLPSTNPSLIEAQGWVTDTNGDVLLTAQASGLTPRSPDPAPSTCTTAHRRT